MAEKGIQAVHDGQCQYQHNGERCRLPGNSSMTLGRGGWYLCLHHGQPGNLRHDAAQDEHFRIFSDPVCVREYVEMHYQNPVRQRLYELLDENPEWQREAGETRTDYVDRMRGLQRPLLGKGIQRMAT